MSFRTLLYYKYVDIPDGEKFAELHLNFCKSINVKGRILISDEGLNGTVSGSLVACQKYMDKMNNDILFQGIEFKIDEVERVAFDKIYVRYKPELVNLNATDQVDPNESNVEHLSPSKVLELKDEDDVVMLDVRNNVEHEVGKFKDAITLDIETFREFPEKIKELQGLKDKTIIAYCTGGIRCEKATMLLKNEGFDNVYQIDGGIHKYSQITGGKDFDGKMYVFDKRVTVDVNHVNPSVISECNNCGTKSSHMVNCANPECNEHFVLCEECGWKLKGCCSEECMNSESVRPYDGSGYYSKGASI